MSSAWSTSAAQDSESLATISLPALPEQAQPDSEYVSAPWQRPISTFGDEEKPGSERSSQQWLQKIEYCLMQNKMASKGTLAELERIRRATVAAERRQDNLAGEPADFLRHWKESELVEKKIMLARESQRHLAAGMCCLPSCLCFLWAVRNTKRAMPRWEKQSKEEEAAWKAEQEAVWAEAAQPENAGALPRDVM